MAHPGLFAQKISLNWLLEAEISQFKDRFFEADFDKFDKDGDAGMPKKNIFCYKICNKTML